MSAPRKSMLARSGVDARVRMQAPTGEIDGTVLRPNSAADTQLYKTIVGGGIISHESPRNRSISVAAGDNNVTYQTTCKSAIVVPALP